jgi:hypothetical protein
MKKNALSTGPEQRGASEKLAPQERDLHATRSLHGEAEINQLTTRKTEAQRRRERAAERRALLVAYAFQSTWAARFLTPDPRSKGTPERQRQYMFMLAAERLAPHLDFLLYDEGDTPRIWNEARILHDTGPLALTKRETQFMLAAVVEMEASTKAYRAKRAAKQR